MNPRFARQQHQIESGAERRLQPGRSDQSASHWLRLTCHRVAGEGPRTAEAVSGLESWMTAVFAGIHDSNPGRFGDGTAQSDAGFKSRLEPNGRKPAAQSEPPGALRLHHAGGTKHSTTVMTPE